MSKITQGAPVTGGDFFGRAKELAHLEHFIDIYGACHLTALRRIGKSSLLKETARRYSGTRPVYFMDVQGQRSAFEFFAKVLLTLNLQQDSIAGKIKAYGEANAPKWLQWFEKRLDKVKVSMGVLEFDLNFDDAPRTEWKQLARHVKSEFDKIDLPERPYFLVDELPFLLQHIAALPRAGRRAEASELDEVEDLLATLALWRNDPSPVRMLITGSLGVRDYLLAQGLSTVSLDNFGPLTLGVLTSSEAREMVTTLGENMPNWSEAHTSETLSLIDDAIPIFIQDFMADARFGEPKGADDLRDFFDRGAGHRMRASLTEQLNATEEKWFKEERKGSALAKVMQAISKASDAGLEKIKVRKVYESAAKGDVRWSQFFSKLQHQNLVFVSGQYLKLPLRTLHYWAEDL